MIVVILLFVAAGLVSAYGFAKIDASPASPVFTWPQFNLIQKQVFMPRYKLTCRNAAGETLFTIEGYQTEEEAQAQLDTLNATAGPVGNTWTLEPLRYN